MKQTRTEKLSEIPPKPSHIWLIADGRPGHQTQLTGLSQRLQKRTGAKLTWTTPDELRFRLRADQTAPGEAPDVIIAAGHRTHRTLYWSARHFKAFSVVLMKPTLPLRLFDAVICPAHDGLKASNRVFNTLGVINRFEPMPPDSKDENEGCILLGGTSKHYHWDNHMIIDQVMDLCKMQSNKRWSLFDSPRTPKDLIDILKAKKPANLEIYSFESPKASKLGDALLKSKTCWISPDSISMIYESLTIGCQTAVLDLKPKGKRPSRVARGIQSLQSRQQIGTWPKWKETGEIPKIETPLWEADRAATWLLERYAEFCTRSKMLRK